MTKKEKTCILSDKQYEKAYRKALSIGKYFCHDFDLAEEIAQLTTIKLYYWRDKVENPDKWIYQVARNHALQILIKQNQTEEFKHEIEKLKKREELPELIQYPNLEKEINNIPESFLDERSKSILFDYFCNEFSREKLSDKYAIEKIRDKLYYLRQELTLYMKFKGNFVFIRNIPGTRLHRNLRNFIHKLFDCVKIQEYSKISEYTDDIESFKVFNEIPEVSHFRSYELRVNDGKSHKLYIVYKTKHNYSFLIYMYIIIKDMKRIETVFSPAVPEKIQMIANDAIKGKDRSISERRKNGTFIYSREELEEIIRKTGAKELRKDDFKENKLPTGEDSQKF